ncbi:MAG: hypothetical protein K1000chlam3_00224 [Chlamydiae bacterium]|nr:hypothetical protein [Chlamydiota bacterium]
MELVQIFFNKIMQSRAYTVIILGNEQKQFAIYTDPLVGRNLQILLTGEPHPRPYTHNLMASIFKGFDIRLKQIIINNIEDTIYFSRLFLEQDCGEQKQILEIDARPSDCLTLALMHNAPVYCRKEVLEQAVPIEE